MGTGQAETPQRLTLDLSLMSEGAAQAVHPEIWALSRLVEASGGDADDAFALGVCGGAGFIGVAFRNTRAGFSTLHVSGWNPFQSNLLAGIERLGLPAIVRETTGRRRAARNLERALEDGGPVVLWVDGATVGLAPTELTGMSPTVVVAEAVSGGVQVAEGPGRLAVVAADVLSQARLANRTHRNRVVTVTPGGAGDLAQLYRRGLAAVAVGAVGGPPGSSGPDGITALAGMLTTDGPGSWTDTFPGGWELRRSLVGLRSAIVREGALLRRPQAGFTAEAARATGLSELAEVAEAYGRLAADWEELADAALPPDVPGLAELRDVPTPWALPKDLAEEPFPLGAVETSQLLHGLAAKLTALSGKEHATLELLRRVLSAQ